MAAELDETEPSTSLMTIGTTHKNRLSCCAVYFRDGSQRVLSGSYDCSLMVWDLTSSKCRRTLSGHTGHVRCCAVNEDGSKALSGSNDESLKVWDLSKGKCTMTLTGHSDNVWCCAVFEDGSKALSGSYDKGLKVWDLEPLSVVSTGSI